MKIRNGFVSNSSSSSFIVINDSGNKVHPSFGDVLEIRMTDGEYEFGWQVEEYYDFNSKFNWCYIIASYQAEEEKERLHRMLIETIEEELGVPVEVNWNAQSEYDYYIDHGSVEDHNMAMFDSKEDLKAFLFDPASYIHNTNDNM